MIRLAKLVVLFLVGLLSLTAVAADNLVFVTWDGFRWQELFAGAEEALLSKDMGGVQDVPALRLLFWRELPEQRRQTLLPFFWNTIARQGQVFGDPAHGATSRVTNGKKFSYPGYNEMFVGFADETITSNSKIANKNINVLEYIHRQPGFGGRVAGFATWDVMEFILNRERSGFPLQTGWTETMDGPLTPGQQQVNEMVRQLPRLWRGNVFDVVTFRAAKEYLTKHQPRVLYIGLGETDEWAHARRYDLYLEAANRSDRYLQELWALLQSLPQYKDQTIMVVTTDHGRGLGRDWANHSPQTVGAEYIWIAVIGSGVPAHGIRKNVETTQSQIAATLASCVGIDFNQPFPQAAPPLPLNLVRGEK
jgi:arylsulfatase A-like enzyme